MHSIRWPSLPHCTFTHLLRSLLVCMHMKTVKTRGNLTKLLLFLKLELLELILILNKVLAARPWTHSLRAHLGCVTSSLQDTGTSVESTTTNLYCSTHVQKANVKRSCMLAFIRPPRLHTEAWTLRNAGCARISTHITVFYWVRAVLLFYSATSEAGCLYPWWQKSQEY